MGIEKFLKTSKVKVAHAFTRLSYKRQARFYCVGAAKTGTHSIGSIFDQTIRSGHEADSEEVISQILAVVSGQTSATDLRTHIRQRDKRLCLDVDSSQLNFFLLDHLLDEFPDARFLLTIRDCYSWLDSFINHSLRQGASDNWTKLRDYRFQDGIFSHPPEEQALQERGLYTLKGYLTYWSHHNNKVLSSVPEDRLLVVKTNEIADKIFDIADFAGLPKAAIQADQAHAFKNSEKFHVLKKISEAYLEATVEEVCGPLMSKFFPEIRSIKDAKL